MKKITLFFFYLSALVLFSCGTYNQRHLSSDYTVENLPKGTNYIFKCKLSNFGIFSVKEDTDNSLVVFPISGSCGLAKMSLSRKNMEWKYSNLLKEIILNTEIDEEYISYLYTTLETYSKNSWVYIVPHQSMVLGQKKFSLYGQQIHMMLNDNSGCRYKRIRKVASKEKKSKGKTQKALDCDQSLKFDDTLSSLDAEDALDVSEALDVSGSLNVDKALDASEAVDKGFKKIEKSVNKALKPKGI